LIRQDDKRWQKIVKSALAREFPCHEKFRAFAEASFSEIVGLLLKGETAVHIYCSTTRRMYLHAGPE
jgi:hypothetical protein